MQLLLKAKEMATVREDLTAALAAQYGELCQEHDQAIGDLGSLTERVAKSAIAGIQRSEDCVIGKSFSINRLDACAYQRSASLLISLGSAQSLSREHISVPVLA